jgi:hypothetical protein
MIHANGSLKHLNQHNVLILQVRLFKFPLNIKFWTLVVIPSIPTSNYLLVLNCSAS